MKKKVVNQEKGPFSFAEKQVERCEMAVRGDHLNSYMSQDFIHRPKVRTLYSIINGTSVNATGAFISMVTLQDFIYRLKSLIGTLRGDDGNSNGDVKKQ